MKVVDVVEFSKASPNPYSPHDTSGSLLAMHMQTVHDRWGTKGEPPGLAAVHT